MNKKLQTSIYMEPIFKKADQKAKNKHSLLKSLIIDTLSSKDIIPPEFNGKDYVSFLLYTDAEIEHCLLVQYLYSAYSIGGAQIPEKYQQIVRSWQEIILGIAKEEMGHLVSVQNILRLIGAPLNLERQNYPWDSPFYPFPFKLEPLTLDSLAKYVYAEAPQKWIESDDIIAKEIVKKVDSEVTSPHRVGALFDLLLELINDPEVISDEVFQSRTYPFQAKFDEWGRGYAGGSRGNAEGGSPTGSPDVLVVPLASRDDAYNALKEIAEQGEGDSLPENGAPSHFERFLKIYKEMREILNETDEKWLPSRNIATNPYVSPNDEGIISDLDNPSGDCHIDFITNPEAKLWGNLFNIRYRNLLDYVNHSFLLDDGFNNSGANSPRGIIINSTFGEMYNLRSIALIMVKIPLTEDVKNSKMAGPPFLMPYTLNLPMVGHNRWRHHKDLLIASQKIVTELLSITEKTNHKYLFTLRQADTELMKVIDQLTDYSGD